MLTDPALAAPAAAPAPTAPAEPTAAARPTAAAPEVRVPDASGGADDVAAVRRPGLSPSRASDFLRCPLLFRFRVVDRLPEPPSEAAVRGTLVHAVLERLFDLPRPERTLEAATGLLAPTWSTLVEEDPELATLVTDGGTDAWLAPAEALLRTYYTLEDPRRLEPADRELAVRTELDGGLELRGIIDRVDIAPDGAIRVVDYKTGRSPREGFESGALFQMRVYALLLSRVRGRVPAMLQLVYMGDGTVVRHVPDEADVRWTERRVQAIWSGIRGAAERSAWQPRPSALCGWCAHQALCPAFGGTAPAVDPDAVESALGVRPLVTA